jgi:NAD(P)-dependent dehydrogenase (short-subunit alcohol dehydrogenase family)
MGVVHGLQACLPRMRTHGQPEHILITSSIGGVMPLWGLGPYGVTKAGAVMLAEILREELRGSLLNVSVMCPGAVRTDLPNNVDRRVPGAWTETALANGCRQTARQRRGTTKLQPHR